MHYAHIMFTCLHILLRPMFINSCHAFIHKYMGTGVDLSKILGGQTKILGDRRWSKVINAWAFLNYCGGTCPGAPKSTPMYIGACTCMNAYTCMHTYMYTYIYEHKLCT